MNHALWSTVDAYFDDCFVPADPVFSETLRTSDSAGLPPHNVSPTQGKFLHLLVKLQGARKILEFGTLGGYSTIWLARALPKDGLLVTLEANPTHAAVAQENIARAGLSSVVDLRVGRAVDTLPAVAREGIAPFDFIFIDADKPNNPTYLEWAVALSRPGTVIIGDNVVRHGAVADATSSDPNVLGIRHFCQLMATHPHLSATALQTVGSKGYDGFSLALVTA